MNFWKLCRPFQREQSLFDRINRFANVVWVEVASRGAAPSWKK